MLEKIEYYDVFVRFRCSKGGEKGGVTHSDTEIGAMGHVEELKALGFGDKENDQRIEVWKITKERQELKIYESNSKTTTEGSSQGKTEEKEEGT